MEPIFRKEFEITDLYVDCFGRLKPSAILFLAQETAGHHCKDLGLSWEQLAEKGLFWAVVRHRVQITRLPHRGETVTAETLSDVYGIKAQVLEVKGRKIVIME